MPIFKTKWRPSFTDTEAQFQLLRKICFSSLLKKDANLLKELLSEMARPSGQGVMPHAALVWLSKKGFSRDSLERALFDGVQRRLRDSPIFLLEPVTWVSDVISEYSELRLSKLKPADRFTAICFDESGDLAQQAVRALSVLSALWPEMANVVKTFVSHILWVESEGYWSGSYAEAHGLVFISPKRDWTLAHYIESLVHEASHLELMVQQALDPLLINKDQLDVSPLREELRPLDGILHASFVTRRTTHALSLFAEASDLGSETERESARSLLNKFTQDFESTLVCLRRAAKFTPIGASLFHDLQH